MKTKFTLCHLSLLNKSSLLVFLFTLALISHTALRAQTTIIGMTSSGGAKDSGLLFKCTVGGVLTPLVSNLDMTNGAMPFQCGLILANDGKFYGMTEQGGANNDGVIFRCDTAGTITVLYSFDNVINGKDPRGNLIQANDGNLYGVTYGGGANGVGTVFKSTLTGVVTTIASFTAATTGQLPRGTLLQANDGNLYGMTQGGGANGDGVLFKCTLAGALTALVTFNGAGNGASTFYGTLLQATDGNLWGTTSNGGANGDGTLFKCTLAGVLTTEVTFNGAGNGLSPLGNMVQATDNNFYGVTSGGGTNGDGTLFRCNILGTLTTLVNFSGAANGTNPAGGLIQASCDSVLYGVTQSGGSNGAGTLYSYSLNGILTTLVNFAGVANGSTPSGSLLAVCRNVAGINTIKANSENVTLFPNPNNGVFQLEIRNYQLGINNTLEVYNMLGEKVYSKQWTMNNGQLTIDLSNNANGIYLYRVLTERGDLVSGGKFVIEK